MPVIVDREGCSARRKEIIGGYAYPLSLPSLDFKSSLINLQILLLFADLANTELFFDPFKSIYPSLIPVFDLEES